MKHGASYPRIPFFTVFGVVVGAVGTAVYSYALNEMTVPTPEAVSNLVPVSVAYFFVIALCTGLVLFDAKRIVSVRIRDITSRGISPLSPGWAIPYVLSVKKYRRVFAVSSVLYGFIYAVITSMIVYQPTVDFAQAYAVTTPSAVVTPVASAPLFSPVVTIYLVNHLGILLIPLTVVLLVATSSLVGLNFSLAGFAFDSRARGAGRGWLGGLGAVVGLFTGCPTCAGLFFANFLGGTGAVSFATLLGYYQPGFILLSIPVLVAAPYLTSRSLSKVFTEGCVFLRKPA